MNEHRSACKFLFLLLLYLIFITDFIILFLVKIFPILKNPDYIGITQILGSVISFLIPLVIYKLKKGIKFSEILMLKAISLKNVLIIIFLAFSFQPLLQLIGGITNIFFEDKVQGTISFMLGLPYWQLISAVAIFPAITEEVVFRGIFLKEYEKSHFLIGVVFSSIFFGLMHLTLTQLFYATAAGIIMALIVKVTKSIWAGILFHFVLNGTQITVAYLVNLIADGESTLNMDSSLQNEMVVKLSEVMYPLFLFLISIPFLIIGIKLFKRINRENISILKEENSNRPLAIGKKNIFNLYFVASIVVYILYIVYKAYYEVI